MSKDALTALHRHFEQQYGKLEFQEARGKKRKRKEPRKEPEEKVESDFEDEEEWQGIQDDDDNVEEKPEPEVVIFNDGTQSDDISTMKPSSFMSSKVPKSAVAKKPAQDNPAESPDEEAENLKNDIALQRLLRESNLLSEYASKDDPGKLHHLTLDARISHLGGKAPAPQKLPTRIHQGIQAAKQKRQVKKEKEAQEAGILMPVKKTAVKTARQRGLNTAAGVGKFKNGMLQISERDIRKINNPAVSSGKRRGKSVKKLFK